MDQHEDISNKDALGGSTDEEGSNDDEANHVNKKISSKHTHVGNINDDSRKTFSSGNESIDGRNVLSQSTDEEGHSYSDEHSRVKRRRKMMKRKASSDMLSKTLRSIEKMLQNQACQEKDCFDLLFSYEMKTIFLENLESYFHVRGLELNFVLSDSELSFINLVLKTDHLFIVSRLMNENTDLMKSIFKKHKEFGKHEIID